MNKKIMYPNGSILRKIAFFFKMIQKSSDDYFFATDIKENMTMVSSNMVNDFDLPGEIFYDMNKYWVPLVHPSDREAFIESLKPPASKAENIGHDFDDFQKLVALSHLDFDKNDFYLKTFEKDEVKR